MTQETFDKICAVYRKYHLTHRQTAHLQTIIWNTFVHRKTMVYVAPGNQAGQATIFKAAKEIIALLNLELKKTHDTR